MAKPPERIEELLPVADAAVLAEVSRVLEQSPQAPQTETMATSTPHQAAQQVVELTVTDVVFGQAGARVKAIKPAGAYALREGNHGPFLLGKDASGATLILGRYGPDTWPEAVVRAAAGKR